MVWFLCLWLPIHGFAGMGTVCLRQEGRISAVIPMAAVAQGTLADKLSCECNQGSSPATGMSGHRGSACMLSGTCALPALPASGIAGPVDAHPVYSILAGSSFKSYIVSPPHHPPIPRSI
jgi:hypothetical protein